MCRYQFVLSHRIPGVLGVGSGVPGAWNRASWSSWGVSGLQGSSKKRALALFSRSKSLQEPPRHVFGWSWVDFGPSEGSIFVAFQLELADSREDDAILEKLQKTP